MRVRKGISIRPIKMFSNLLTVAVLIFVSSCIGQQGGSATKRSSKAGTTTSSGGNTPAAPTFPSTSNYFQNGTVTSNTITTLAIQTTDAFYLRGNQIHTFISDFQTTTTQCLIVPFATQSKVLVIAAKPQSFNNLSTGSKEYYYALAPNDKTSNQTFCQKTGLINKLGLTYPSQTLIYSFNDICTNCTNSSIASSAVSVYDIGGVKNSNIQTTSLSIKVTTTPVLDNNVLSCSSSATCKAKGYDCCSLGQCVNDKQIKSNIDQSSLDFLQAQQDILATPANIYNYPNFYYLCSAEVYPLPTPSPAPNPNEDAVIRFNDKKNLYDCINPVEGEMGLCTIIHKDVQKAGTTVFTTGDDDRNFNSTYTGTSSLPLHSIDRVIYAGETLFENSTFLKSGLTFGPGGDGSGNDNLTDPQFLNLTYTPSTSAPDDDLLIKYKIDASCSIVNNSIAKCYKIYVQGQNLGKVHDHYPASNEFILPFYADTNKTIKVEVDDTTRLNGTHWQLIQTAPARIEFIGSSLQVYDTQVVKVTYFVDLTSYNVLQKKREALETVKTMCQCADLNCNLKPELDSSNNIVDYICSYPSGTPGSVPLQQTVLMSSKTVPHRYFDQSGVYQKEIGPTTLQQEGLAFAYTSNNLLKPNNVSTTIGFNEIYGSFNLISGSAKPAKEVTVEKGKSYDIFVDSGSFSTCFYCGSDYYSNLARIFPQSFLSNGSGYVPDSTTSSKINTSTYRGDDLLFGRACFVPVTMLPWSHDPDSDRQQQRLKRLSAQHFMFANGYQRDWFGFDYGSVIGSFDGVKWFSVGNQRRIKAETSKLFLAINAYYGDQTLESTYTITVSDASTVPLSGSTVTADFNSDGAECQKFHVCSVDRDCIAQLGYDYVCESVSTLNSKWPQFDTNGLEVPGSELTLNLYTLFGASAGGSKRCVYRGRGTPCTTNYSNIDSSVAFNNSDRPGTHMCSSNNYCQRFTQGIPQTKFNNRIARYGKSVAFQNASSDVPYSDADQVGLGARILGRPYDWNGTESINTEAQSALTNNNVSSICIPGRNPENDLLSNSHSNALTSSYLGDQISGIGMSIDSTLNNSAYLSSCGPLDATGEYLAKTTSNLSKLLSDSTITKFAGRDNLSTNALKILENLSGNEIVKNFETEHITSLAYQENRCLRAPGSSCFSDLDCAANKFISDRAANIDSTNASNTAILNKYEIKFWQERLVCGQEKLPTETGFDLKENRCCREMGNTITIGTYVNEASRPQFSIAAVPGIDEAMDSSSRNSRVSTVYDLIQDATNYPTLFSAPANACTSGSGCVADSLLTKQYNTFAATAERTCCTGHWVRNFDKVQNGGGHVWTPAKMQNIAKNSFECLNWSVCNNTTGNTCGSSAGRVGFSCNHVNEPDDPACFARATSNSEAKPIFDWLNTIELLGVPQIKVKGPDFSDIACKVNPNDQSSAPSVGALLPPGLVEEATAVREFEDGSGFQYYSSIDDSNFVDGMKKVFSEDEVSCCKPLGSDMSPGSDPNLCCSGFINPGTNKCQMRDYTNLSVFFNRYISSAAKGLATSLIDSDTGYIKSASTVEQLACQLKACASGKLARGIVLSNLKYPGHEASEKLIKRFVDGSDTANNFSGLSDLYDAGLKWNEDVYCVPEDLEIDTITDCANF
ncbi:MAG: hypothetical protein COW00_09605 [Bdellovibrio sp. CG12_big_fil_rev_8_21_14_0_65_39_13]|nr:MAG: hypothetical protein COW78_16130 [Bdellovibrio sp. CG22_combo_CG10-13_8_21_14_all_39_27]PIQ59634.1 MAG: hypothetical protein COW00_09605 [Bdellovibrio sp. CG12_big_fil_rev_8_21_14_0_65_39_13]PIR34506.1 MAG: hypothetical protein COV37_12895 [Bdellovibrio sp. CG11_big_fil_rev_8_21_14_0_20_39_38]